MLVRLSVCFCERVSALTYEIGYNVFRLRRGKEPAQIFTGLAAGLIRYARAFSLAACLLIQCCWVARRSCSKRGNSSCSRLCSGNAVDARMPQRSDWRDGREEDVVWAGSEGCRYRGIESIYLDENSEHSALFVTLTLPRFSNVGSPQLCSAPRKSNCPHHCSTVCSHIFNPATHEIQLRTGI
jgi:hypothetical protein